ncbi:MAG: hypothetical protein O3B86_08905, partial [Planctomycetota bacterium]|nr:hypothetical protein [Planctomycetota bacterium]
VALSRSESSTDSSVSARQDEPGTATIVDTRSSEALPQKEDSPDRSLRKRLDPFGLFTLSKQE